jgi:hypothetical protein
MQDRYFEPASLNFYTYVTNNPLLRIDPTGKVEGDPTPGGKTAAERLQEIIDAILALERAIKMMEVMGLTRLSINGRTDTCGLARIS